MDHVSHSDSKRVNTNVVAAEQCETSMGTMKPAMSCVNQLFPPAPPSGYPATSHYCKAMTTSDEPLQQRAQSGNGPSASQGLHGSYEASSGGIIAPRSPFLIAASTADPRKTNPIPHPHRLMPKEAWEKLRAKQGDRQGDKLRPPSTATRDGAADGPSDHYSTGVSYSSSMSMNPNNSHGSMGTRSDQEHRLYGLSAPATSIYSQDRGHCLRQCAPPGRPSEGNTRSHVGESSHQDSQTPQSSHSSIAPASRKAAAPAAPLCGTPIMGEAFTSLPFLAGPQGPPAASNPFATPSHVGFPSYATPMPYHQAFPPIYSDWMASMWWQQYGAWYLVYCQQQQQMHVKQTLEMNERASQAHMLRTTATEESVARSGKEHADGRQAKDEGGTSDGQRCNHRAEGARAGAPRRRSGGKANRHVSHDSTPVEHKYSQTDPFSMYRHNMQLVQDMNQASRSTSPRPDGVGSNGGESRDVARSASEPRRQDADDE